METLISQLLSTENLIALATLTALEIVLGIDNIVFIAILSGKLPGEQRQRARLIGLAAAMVMRVLLLLLIGWITTLRTEWLTFPLLDRVLGEEKTGLSWRDIILLVGGFFLIVKATHEIHGKLESGEADESGSRRSAAAFGWIIIQIMLMDVIFSIDSVITAVGMARELWVMIVAVMIAVGVMMLFARKISDFVEQHPTIKMLGLSFLLLIGVMLVAEGFGRGIEKGYIYFAMGFSLAVELLNLRMRKVRKPVRLKQPHWPETSETSS